jgi:hypothetical protein
LREIYTTDIIPVTSHPNIFISLPIDFAVTNNFKGKKYYPSNADKNIFGLYLKIFTFYKNKK